MNPIPNKYDFLDQAQSRGLSYHSSVVEVAAPWQGTSMNRADSAKQQRLNT